LLPEVKVEVFDFAGELCFVQQRLRLDVLKTLIFNNNAFPHFASRSVLCRDSASEGVSANEHLADLPLDFKRCFDVHFAIKLGDQNTLLLHDYLSIKDLIDFHLTVSLGNARNCRFFLGVLVE